MQLVLNLTRSSFIVIINSAEYNKKMNELLTPFGRNTLSHWDKTDKIVIVPEKLNEYVIKTYNEIYI